MMAECMEGGPEYFLPDFKEYMERELKYSRLERSGFPPGYKPHLGMLYGKSISWVFWNRQDDDLTISYDHSVDSFPKIRPNIRYALHKLISYAELQKSLVQFWAPTRTSEGRTLLTTQFQPFALGKTYDTDERNRLCEYRMGMCREYNNSFYADAECAQEQLGLPGRVFLSKLPEHAPGVEFYTLKEYPQRHLALRCEILFSWALPVFEQSSHTCVGVLEIAYHNFDYCPWADKEFLGRMYDIFQEFGLRCFDGYKHYKIQDGDKNKALTTAFQELDMVYESLCKIHDLTLALTWVSCRSCNHLLQSQFLTYCFEEDYDKYSFFLEKFKQVSKVSHLRKGQVAGRTLSFPNLLCCSDVKQFHIDEFPLVPFARGCELGGWFAMCLQSSYTGDELFILEFFLSRSTENDENILTKLRLILGTMEENFKTFKLASGQELGEALSVEVIDFQNGLKSHSIQMIPATRCIPGLELLQDVGVMLQQVQLDQPSMDAINNGMHVVSETQNYNLPSLDSLQNGKVTTQVDSSDQQSMDPSGQGLGEALSIEVSDFQNGQKSHSIQVPATRCIPGLELLQDGGVMLQQDLQDQPSMDVINSGMYVVSEAQNYNLPILDSLQNGKVTTQVDSSDQQSMDPSNKGQNAVTVERNILVVSSSKKGKRKTQDEEHKKAGVRIEVPLEKILKCSEMRRKDAAKVLKVSTSTLKRVCRDFGINRWPPRNIEDGSYQPLPVENLGQTPQLNYDLPSNQASASVAHLKPSFQDANMVTIRAMFENNVIKFRLSLSATLVEMQQEVAKRLNLEGGTYYIKYTDEEGLLILIACDEDLQYYLHACRSLGISSIAIQLEQK